MVFASSLEKRKSFKRQDTISTHCRINVTYPLENQLIKVDETSWVIWNTTSCGDLTYNTVVQVIIYGWNVTTEPPWPIVYTDTAYYGVGYVEFKPQVSWSYEENYIAMVFPVDTVGLSGVFYLELDD
ncbi:12455_t:CDS:2, partial [Dentiscutata heterogama]